MTGSKDDPEEFPEAHPDRVDKSDAPATTTAPSPRAARFGEGVEGRGARRERGVSGGRDNAFERSAKFLHDTRTELKRVSWPTGTEVRNTTIITVVAVIFFAIYLYAVDHALAWLIDGIQWVVNRLLGAA